MIFIVFYQWNIGLDWKVGHTGLLETLCNVIGRPVPRNAGIPDPVKQAEGSRGPILESTIKRNGTALYRSNFRSLTHITINTAAAADFTITK